jgi:hypothetical protein
LKKEKKKKETYWNKKIERRKGRQLENKACRYVKLSHQGNPPST